ITAHHLLARKNLAEQRLVLDSVLKREEDALVSQAFAALLSRRDRILRFDAKQYQIVGREFVRTRRRLYREVKIADDALHLETVRVECAQMLAARAVVNLLAGSLQPCAIKCADRARAHHQNLHDFRYRERAECSASLAERNGSRAAALRNSLESSP